MKKRKQSKAVRIILLAAGSLFICASVYFLVCGIRNYARQFEQTKWEVTTATVINVEAHRTVGHNIRDSSYDIYYQYEAGGNVYTGVLYRVNARRKVGESFDVKYDPEAPQNSTHYLELTSGFVVSGLFGFVVFGAIGLRMVQSASLKRRKADAHNRNKVALTDKDGNGT